MRQISWKLTGVALFSLPCLSLHAQQTPIDYLEKDLAQVQQDHEAMTAQALANFFAQTDSGRGSPDAALALYQDGGGAMPSATAVQSRHDHETQRERAERESQDTSKQVGLALVAQLQCGLMRFGGAFIVKPDEAGLHDAWVTWLKSTPQIYTQIPVDLPPEAKELKNKPIKDSPINRKLEFKSWGDKEQGAWAVKEIPKLYRKEILEPLRATPTADTLIAWDVYIDLRKADQPDPDKWAQNDLPPIAFERACDDYTITGSMDKLQVVVQIIKANPGLSKLDDMIARTKGLLADYRTRHPSANAALANAAPAPVADPNVSVHTEGDMTIITTSHPTNAAPNAPAPQ